MAPNKVQTVRAKKAGTASTAIAGGGGGGEANSTNGKTPQLTGHQTTTTIPQPPNHGPQTPNLRHIHGPPPPQLHTPGPGAPKTMRPIHGQTAGTTGGGGGTNSTKHTLTTSMQALRARALQSPSIHRSRQTPATACPICMDQRMPQTTMQPQPLGLPGSPPLARLLPPLRNTKHKIPRSAPGPLGTLPHSPPKPPQAHRRHPPGMHGGLLRGPSRGP